jgi:predicted TPR repeat methyltransferase
VPRCGEGEVARLYADLFLDGLVQNPNDAGQLDASAVAVLNEADRSAGGRVVVDLGCGPGYVTEYLAESGLAASGIDGSSEMIAIAAETFPKLTFGVADFRSTGLLGGSRGGVVSRYCCGS